MYLKTPEFGGKGDWFVCLFSFVLILKQNSAGYTLLVYLVNNFGFMNESDIQIAILKDVQYRTAVFDIHFYL